MGLFDKIFSNKEKQSEKTYEKEVQKNFDSPYGKFWYSSTPACDEYGYECEIDWNDGDAVKACVFVETDTLETEEAGLCYERFERIFQDRQRFDYEAKNIVAEFIISHPQYFFDSLYEEVDKETLIDNMKIIWLGVRRNGDIEYSMETFYVDADNTLLIVSNDGSKKIEYDDTSEMCHREYLFV